ncbi:MAG: methyltransferase [Cyanobacteriota bacterium]|nr:methyltransferase [Cyanobacteriota bacterium]
MIDKIYDIGFDYWNSAVLRAGIKLGVFTLLEREPLSAEKVANQLQTNAGFTSSFLEACTILELLEKVEDRYKNAEETSKFLVSDRPEYIGDHVLHITNYWLTWGNLDTLIREGRTEFPFENGFVNADTYWSDYMKGQHSRATSGQGAYLVENVNLEGKRKLLDLGGGAASYSIALCNAYPQLQAFVVDEKESLAVAGPLVEENNLNNQITLVEGDFNTIALDSDHDVVLISGVVVLKSEEDSRQLFRRAYNALLPGGLIVIQDFMQMDSSPKRRFLDIMMDLYVKIGFHPEGSDRSSTEILSWLQDVGFKNFKQVSLPTQYALIAAEKPASA